MKRLLAIISVFLIFSCNKDVQKNTPSYTIEDNFQPVNIPQSGIKYSYKITGVKSAKINVWTQTTGYYISAATIPYGSITTISDRMLTSFILTLDDGSTVTTQEKEGKR